jgi:hypothetical protein
MHELAQLDTVEIGSQIVTDQVVYLQAPSHLQALDHHILGVIGGDVLRHFDVLFDQDNSSLCLDNAGIMQTFIRRRYRVGTNARRRQIL